MVGDTWDPTSSMSTLNYFLAGFAKDKARLHQLNFIGEFIPSNFKDKVLVDLVSRYGEYLLEYANYSGIPLSLKK